MSALELKVNRKDVAADWHITRNESVSINVAGYNTEDRFPGSQPFATIHVVDHNEGRRESVCLFLNLKQACSLRDSLDKAIVECQV